MHFDVCEDHEEFHDEDEESTNCTKTEIDSGCSPTIDETMFSSDSENISAMNIQEKRVVKRLDSCIDECEFHEQKTLKYFCKACNKIGCSVCNNLDHKQCEGVEYIPTFVTKPEHKFEEMCTEFEKELELLEATIKACKTKLCSNHETVNHLKRNALLQVENARMKVNNFFNHLEDKIKNKIDSIEVKDLENLDIVDEGVQKMEREVEVMKNSYAERRHLGNKSSIFSNICLSSRDMNLCQTTLKKLDDQNIVTRYAFKTSDEVKAMSQNISELGRTELVKSTETLNMSEKHRIKIAQAEEKTVKLTGLAVLECGKLVAVDCKNYSMKLVNTNTREILFTKRLSAEPLDVTVIQPSKTRDEVQPEERIAVTIPVESKVLLVDVQLNAETGSFLIQREIIVNGPCRGIAYNEEKLYITFPQQAKIEIIDLHGKLLKRITNETIGKPLFEPHFLAFGLTRGVFFVTDKCSHSVMCMSLDGVVLSSFQHDELIEPRGICADNARGAIFVCSFSEGKIFHLTEELTYVEMIVVEENAKAYPHSMAFSDLDKLLYCGQLTGDCIVVFEAMGHSVRNATQQSGRKGFMNFLKSARQ